LVRVLPNPSTPEGHTTTTTTTTGTSDIIFIRDTTTRDFEIMEKGPKACVDRYFTTCKNYASASQQPTGTLALRQSRNPSIEHAFTWC
jgi:hypothetical protein